MVFLNSMTFHDQGAPCSHLIKNCETYNTIIGSCNYMTAMTSNTFKDFSFNRPIFPEIPQVRFGALRELTQIARAGIFTGRILPVIKLTVSKQRRIMYQ